MWGIVLKEVLFFIQDCKLCMVYISFSVFEFDGLQMKFYIMICQSGGEVEVYIEFVLFKL